MSWTQGRLLRTGPGHALATEIADAPHQAHLLVTGALDRLARWEQPQQGVSLSAQDVAQLLDDYLYGLAAAAIVADSAAGTRQFTGAVDFAVGGREAPLEVRPVTLGLLSMAASAVLFSYGWACPLLAGHAAPGVMEEHLAQMRAVRECLAAAAQQRLEKQEGGSS